MNLICQECKQTFGERYNLRAHIKKFHKEKLEILAPLKTFKTSAVCNECNKTFVKYSNLTQHVRKYHKDKQTQLIKSKKYKYECNICQKHFTHLPHFKYHKKTHEEKKTSGLKCILCKKESHSEYFTKPDLFKHFKIRHDIDIQSEQLCFASLEEFKTWKTTTLAAFRSSKNINVSKQNKNVPHNKKIAQQRRLFRTKKNRVGIKKDKITKPDGQDANKIALNMLLSK